MKSFDHVNHDILMERIGRKIRDKRVLKLIGKMLRRGALVGEEIEPAEEGTPQGGPLSPLLANIYLDALDQELERRGHAFCRYADDCNIYVSSQAAAERVLESIREWIGEHLRLQLNEAKSGVGRAWERKFLGFGMTPELAIGIAPESVERFKAKVRERWRGNQSVTSNQLRDNWKTFIRGWWNYYGLTEERRPIRKLEGWIRTHIRKYFWLRWHCGDGREKALRKLGVKDPTLKTARSSRGAWRMAHGPAMKTGLKNAVLRRFGFLMPSDLAAESC